MNNHFEELNSEILRGLSGKNSGIPMGFNRLNKYIGIRKRIYTLVFGATGSGKSAYTHSAYILNPFDWWWDNKSKTNIKLKIILFSMERSKVYTLSKWLSRKIFLDQGILIPIQKMLGWWETKLTPDEHDLIKMYEDYINELCETVTILEGAHNPMGIKKYLQEFAESRGKIEEVSKFTKIYHPNDENEIVIPIIDHLGLVKTESGKSKKESIDLVSGHLQMARDLYGYSPVAVSQINRDLSNPIYQKLSAFEPNLDQVKESGRPAEDSDCVVSLFQPHRYKTEDAHYGNVERFIDPNSKGDFFRSIKILKNTYGEADIAIGMAFQGATGIFKELPKPKHMAEFDYNQLFNGTYFLSNE